MPKTKKNPDLPNSLLIKTLELLENRSRKLSIEKIADDTGLPYYWIQKLSVEQAHSVNRVQVLYEYLAHVKLDV